MPDNNCAAGLCLSSFVVCAIGFLPDSHVAQSSRQSFVAQPFGQSNAISERNRAVDVTLRVLCSRERERVVAMLDCRFLHIISETVSIRKQKPPSSSSSASCPGLHHTIIVATTSALCIMKHTQAHRVRHSMLIIITVLPFSHQMRIGGTKETCHNNTPENNASVQTTGPLLVTCSRIRMLCGY